MIIREDKFVEVLLIGLAADVYSESNCRRRRGQNLSSASSWTSIPTGAIPTQKIIIPTKKLPTIPTTTIPILMPTKTISKFL